jgi:dihydroxyacetone kinase phosphoprotein-dependent L subunit
MEEIRADQFRDMLNSVCDSLIKNEELLCQLDSVVGDGDHGLTVSRGFSAVKRALAEAGETGVSAQLELAGNTLAETMGGVIGPIFGGIFSGMAEAPLRDGAVDTAVMAAMLAAGLENAALIGGAKPGDRTLIDGLAPAAAAAKEEAAAGTPLSAALEKIADAARAGAEATKDMIAKRGRAKFLQEKSKGYQDAGATSLYLALDAMRGFLVCQS